MSALVSVILPTHNSEEYVAESLASILAQTHTDLEVLVTDDASVDRTIEIVAEVARDDPRVTIRSHTDNLGAACTRNASITRASGDYIAFCDADDRWLPRKIERQLAFMQATGSTFTFTSFELITAEGQRTGRLVDSRGPASVDYEDMLRKRATLGCSTVMLDRRTHRKVTMPNLRTGQDYATWLVLLRAGHRAHCLKEALTEYRITPGSLSRNKLRKAQRQWQIYRQVEGLGLANAVNCFVHYAYRAVFRV